MNMMTENKDYKITYRERDITEDYHDNNAKSH